MKTVIDISGYKSLEELEQLRSKAAKIKNKQNLEYWINKYPQNLWIFSFYII